MAAATKSGLALSTVGIDQPCDGALDEARTCAHPVQFRKSGREPGIQFRPVEATLSDTIRWYHQNGWLKTPELKKIPLRASEQRSGTVENRRCEPSYNCEE